MTESIILASVHNQYDFIEITPLNELDIVLKFDIHYSNVIRVVNIICDTNNKVNSMNQESLFSHLESNCYDIDGSFISKYINTKMKGKVKCSKLTLLNSTVKGKWLAKCVNKMSSMNSVDQEQITWYIEDLALNCISVRFNSAKERTKFLFKLGLRDLGSIDTIRVE